MSNQKVTVLKTDGTLSTTTLAMPKTLCTPVIKSIVEETFRIVDMDKRQPYAVSKEAGMQHSAESWGTGRALARVPRVKGSGTRRAGEAAFANFCRKGRMAHPTKVTRRWQRKVNLSQKLHACCVGLSATVNPNFVQSRGHLVENVSSLPIVFEDNLHNLVKTRSAVDLLTKIGLQDEVERVKESKHIRPGKGKWRNRRYRQRRGILIIHNDNDILGFRNVPGVEFMNINNLDLLKICPGGHLGRLCIWTESAFKNIDSAVEKAFNKDKDYARMESLISEKNRSSNLMDLFYKDNVQALLEDIPYKEYERVHDPKFILKKNGCLLNLYK
ncbi:hypothetical protein EDEG_02118 [Edhazardia aedis USNM 41457]|uniref:60S ribosomal protein L4 C-terminal domain-containing protein n=1 Tax=Edhazardia aedis (strain USNM 41457) TaxID=1003232 RepID=J9D7N4_EDHAE|nr:hypothetical protein EDEG_02118 [Edhazardia aedis USNM 41457]|eukprot:EJW03534.1 hypothetical protein EDEG_02118 [Edhazardia aedis USNM 41457]